jgi:hypothetical protein
MLNKNTEIATEGNQGPRKAHPLWLDVVSVEMAQQTRAYENWTELGVSPVVSLYCWLHDLTVDEAIFKDPLSFSRWRHEWRIKFAEKTGHSTVLTDGEAALFVAWLWQHIKEAR